jgi:hypothetical protein
MRLLARTQFRVAAFEHNSSRDLLDKARNHTQQGAFAGPVRPGQDQSLAGRNRKADAGKHSAATPNAGEIVAGQLHRHDSARRRLLAWRRRTVSAGAVPGFFPEETCSKLLFIWQNRKKVPINWHLDA